VNVGGIQDACRVFNRTRTIYLTVENVNLLGTFEMLGAGAEGGSIPSSNHP